MMDYLKKFIGGDDIKGTEIAEQSQSIDHGSIEQKGHRLLDFLKLGWISLLRTRSFEARAGLGLPPCMGMLLWQLCSIKHS